MTQYGIFRGNEMVGRVIFNSYNEALKERDSWNKQFEQYNNKVKNDPNFKNEKPITYVEVKEYRKKRQTAEQKLKEMFG